MGGSISATVYNPDDGYIYATGTTGVWGTVDCAAYLGGGSMLCFGINGVFCMNLPDNSYTKIATGAWHGMHAALYDPVTQTVVVFGFSGIYRLNPENGTHEKVMDGMWGTVHGAVYNDTSIALQHFPASNAA